MDEFRDFEAYMTKVECWGSRSGIIKVIPPKEWTASLPSLKPQLGQVKIRTPIEQHMLGRGGLFRQENMEKRKVMSVREWAELCAKDDFRAPGVNEVGLHARSANYKPKAKKSKKKGETAKAESLGPDIIAIKQEPNDATLFDTGLNHQPIVLSPPSSIATPISPTAPDNADAESDAKSVEKAVGKGRRVAQTRGAREASLADRSARDTEFLQTFDPHADWLPSGTKPTDYTPGFCQKLERQYWRNCGLGRPAWYGADTQGSLYTDETTSWNVAHLSSTLTRLLPSSDQGLPGVNTPYLYFGMWRATFAWHVEDMDLFSINYIHFGAPKFWYSVPQGRAKALEQTMRGYFPKDTSTCPQFLRHKSFLASPTLLAQSSCRPNHLVQHAGEFVVTFPRGYHAGFNLGFNCAESVNFALDSWLDLGRVAKACECISDSVRIDVDQLLRDRAREVSSPPESAKAKRLSPKKENIVIKIKKETNDHILIPTSSRKRKSEGGDTPALKKIKIKAAPSNGVVQAGLPARKPLPKLSVTLKLGPRPAEPESYPCCLCVSTNREGLLRVHDPPVTRKDAIDAAGNPEEWLAHEYCANIVPETWVDEIESGQCDEKEKVVFGVDGIVKDRWHLKCSACMKNRPKAHGAPIQCTKGKCPKAFHVSCARDSQEGGIVFNVLKEVEKEVVLLDPIVGMTPITSTKVDPSTCPVDPIAMNVGLLSPPSRVIKVIKKFEIQVLCTQHNPAVAAAKKASKQDKIKNDLLALPNMARIKIRVSAGVFEVSLVRVIEETSSVEVVWDRGIKREFKWGSVVFGTTDGPVHQKPSEPAPDSQPPRSAIPLSSGLPVPTYASVTAATAMHIYQPGQPYSNVVASTTKQSFANQTQYPHPSGRYDKWPYQTPYTGAQSPQNPYGYGYYSTGATGTGSSSHYNGYAYSQSPYPPTQLQWQQPYQNQGYYVHGQAQQHAQPHSMQKGDPSFSGASCIQPVTPVQVPPAVQGPAQTQPSPIFGSVDTDRILASLQPAQIEEVLRNNPQLRDVVIAAINDAKKGLPSPS